MASELVQSGFDFTTVPTEHRENVEAATRRLHALERKTSEAIIEIGKELISVKASIGHGNFLPWLEAEFGWHRDTANNFMQVAMRFADVEISDISSIQPSALYALASPSTPDEVRVEFTELAAMGKPVRHQDVKQEIDRRKPSPQIPVNEWRDDPVDMETGEILDDGPPPAEEVDPSDPSTFLAPPRPISDSRRQPDPVIRTAPQSSPASLEFSTYGPDYDTMTFRSLELALDATFGDGFAERFARWKRAQAA